MSCNTNILLNLQNTITEKFWKDRIIQFLNITVTFTCANLAIGKHKHTWILSNSRRNSSQKWSVNHFSIKFQLSRVNQPAYRFKGNLFIKSTNIACFSNLVSLFVHKKHIKFAIKPDVTSSSDSDFFKS